MEIVAQKLGLNLKFTSYPKKTITQEPINCFQTKNPNLGKFWRVLRWKMMVYFMDTRSILRSFVIFYGHLVKFVVIRYISPRFGILYQEKSGNPDMYIHISGLPRCVRIGLTSSQAE
jgi:hypothetical protein